MKERRSLVDSGTGFVRLLSLNGANVDIQLSGYCAAAKCRAGAGSHSVVLRVKPWELSRLKGAK